MRRKQGDTQARVYGYATGALVAARITNLGFGVMKTDKKSRTPKTSIQSTLSPVLTVKISRSALLSINSDWPAGSNNLEEPHDMIYLGSVCEGLNGGS